METIRIDTPRPALARITLARPAVKNAFSGQMLRELVEGFGGLADDCRVVVLTGEGDAFSAGADLNWMKESVNYSEQENRADAAQMVTLFRAMEESSRIIVGRINGTALGGALGLVAGCDIAIAANTAKLGFTEVRLGLVPAVISPLVVRKMGFSAARRYFVTGEIFSAEDARAAGLLHCVVPVDALDESVDKTVGALLKNGPVAIGEAKRLVREVSSRELPEALAFAVDLIAKLRASPEGQEGLGAFLEKRKPAWLD